MSFVSPNQLDTSNPGTWPIYYKALVWVVIAAAIVFGFKKAVVDDMIAEEEANNKKLEKNKATFKDLYAKTLDLDLYRARSQELMKQLEGLLIYLPKQNQVAKLIDDVYTASSDNGINWREYRPIKQTVRRYYDVYPINLNTTTYYPNFAKFAEKLVELDQIMNINNFNFRVANANERVGMGTASTNFTDSAIFLRGQLQTYVYNQDIEALRRGELPKTNED